MHAHKSRLCGPSKMHEHRTSPCKMPRDHFVTGKASPHPLRARELTTPHPEGLTTRLVPVEVDLKQQIFDVCSSLNNGHSPKGRLRQLCANGRHPTRRNCCRSLRMISSLASLRRFVRSQGYSVQAFASAADFLASPRLKETAVLIADVNMRAMTGIELYRHFIDA